MININTLPPFKKMCVTIGNLPSSFMESMSYYEALCWLVNYLQNEVIPTVNTNSEAIIELQNVFTTLETYVNTYFDNLDVQEEINNKLDDMVESGTLQEIIADYLNSRAVFGFDTVSDMKSATNLIDGSFAETLGYHTKNDGGKAIYKIRTITNSDIINEGSIIALSDENLIAELIEKDIVTPEMFGAYGDNTHDDYTAIQNAMDYIEGGVVLFQNKTYLIGNTLITHQGLKLSGNSAYGNDNAILKLKNNVNKPILQTPKAAGSEATHYMILENLRFDGNGLNQTTENTLIEYHGAYIGSIIRNCYITNFFGSALSLQYADIEIDNLWIQNGYTLSNKYAFVINPTQGAGVISTMANINNLYLENYRNKIEGNPRTTEGDRANGLYIRNASNVNINELHMEGLKYPITIEGDSFININMARCIWCGLTSDSNNSAIYLLSAPRQLYVSNLFRTGECKFSYWINKSNDVTSNSLVTIPFENSTSKMVLPLYVVQANASAVNPVIQYPTFVNNAQIKVVGNPSNAGYYINGTNGTSYIRQDGQRTNIGTNVNQSSDKNYITLVSNGNNGDRIEVLNPILLPTRTTYGYMNAGAIYNYQNNSFGTGPIYQTVTGSKYNYIASVQILSSAPSENAHYIGEMALDYTNKKLYIATSIGKGGNDWYEITITAR